MDLKQLQTFVAVYETGSVSKAAKRLFATQPGLSTHIKQLEEGLGTELFQRSTTGVEPTIAGRKMYKRAVSILRDVEETRQEISDLSEEVSGSIKFGLVPSAMHGLAPTLLPRFKNKYPQVQILLKEAYSRDLTNLVRNSELDFAIVIEPSNLDGLTTEKIVDDNLVLISAKSDRRRRTKVVDLTKSGALKLVVPTTGNGLRDMLDRHINAGEITISDLIQMDSVYGSIEFIRHTDWSTILPYTSVALHQKQLELEVRPIAAPQMPSNFFIVHQTRFPLRLPARRLVEQITRELERLQP